MIHVRRSSILVLAVVGCMFDASGQGTGLELGAGSSGSEGTGQASTSGSSTTLGIDGSSGSGGGSEASTTMPPEPGTGTSTTGEPLPTAHTCKEILDQDPSATTGVYAVLHARDGVAVDVHCEMELDGGGWTLVARSAVDSQGRLGWGVARGTVGEVGSPYSLDALDLGLELTEILITRRMGFATPADTAYVITVPPGFLEDYRTKAYESDGARTVLGDCEPGSGPTMLRWVGYTENEESFFFRDFPENDPWGLFPGELRTAYDGCGQGADLNGRQGALFVR